MFHGTLTLHFSLYSNFHLISSRVFFACQSILSVKLETLKKTRNFVQDEDAIGLLVKSINSDYLGSECKPGHLKVLDSYFKKNSIVDIKFICTVNTIISIISVKLLHGVKPKAMHYSK